MTKKHFLIFSLVLSTVVHSLPIVNDSAILKNAQEKLSTVGTLEATHDGFVYVKVSEDYIHETLKSLNKNVIAPPAYLGVRKVGAHIAAISQKESKKRKLFLPQLGQPIVFAVKSFNTIKIGEKLHYYFDVEAPQIELIRLFNGLPPNISNHAFHITVGIEHRD